MSDNVAEVGDIGLHNDWARLESYDGHEFYIARRYINHSPTAKSMLAGPGMCDPEENADDVAKIHLTEICSKALGVICVYLQYKVKYTDAWFAIPSFPVDPDIAAEILVAASFLKI